jgi:hypothetical protein
VAPAQKVAKGAGLLQGPVQLARAGQEAPGGQTGVQGLPRVVHRGVDLSQPAVGDRQAVEKLGIAGDVFELLVQMLDGLLVPPFLDHRHRLEGAALVLLLGVSVPLRRGGRSGRPRVGRGR